MIISALKGGLGNQMFQYAAGRRMALANGTDLKLDLSFLQRTKYLSSVTPRSYELNNFNISESFAGEREVRRMKNLVTRTVSKVLPQMTFNTYIQEKSARFDPSVLELRGNRYLDGYWNSELYFRDVELEIRKDFTFTKPLLDEAGPIYSNMQSTDSICIQVRRGDYVSNPQVAAVHGVTSLDFFKNAIALVEQRVKKPAFFIFSDDVKWCVENFGTLPNVTFVEKELANVKATGCDFLQLMTKCRNFIISNSTYGWWAAWLSENNNKIVVAPKNWMNDKTIDTSDVCPSGWIKL